METDSLEWLGARKTDSLDVACVMKTDMLNVLFECEIQAYSEDYVASCEGQDDGWSGSENLSDDDVVKLCVMYNTESKKGSATVMMSKSDTTCRVRRLNVLFRSKMNKVSI